MTNRLHKQPTASPVLLALCLFILPITGLQAQSSFFNFTPPANTTYPVGPTCSQSVAGANPVPTVTSTIGANIITSQFDPVMSGYLAGDFWPAPTLNLQVYWFVEDDQGHSYTFLFTVSFVDQTPPALQNLPPASASYSSIVQVPAPPTVTALDNCLPNNPSVNYVQSNPPDTCATGVFTRTWTATDASNNTAVFTQTITITGDNNPPAISIFPQNGSAPCEQLATAYPAWLAQQMSVFAAVDASGIKSYTNNAPPAYPPGCKVPITVTFRATDNCNFNATTTAVFTTSDNKVPVVLSLAKDTVAYCSPSNNHLTQLGAWIKNHGYASVIDSCSGPLTFSMKIGGVSRDSAQVVAAFLASYANGCASQMIGNQTYGKVRGKVTVEFSAADACGNSTVVDQATFGAIDTLPPVISGVGTIEQCGGGDDNAKLQAWINAHGNASVTDDCSGTIWTNFSFLTSTGQSGTGVFNGGPYPQVQVHNCTWYVDVTFRATDDCGNISSKVLRFQIQDTQKPVIAGFPDTVTLSCPNPMPTLSPTFVTDNCDTSTVITHTFLTSDTLCPGSYTMTVTWSATDDCGNTGTAVQTILVRDTEGPIFTLVPPADTFRCDTFVLPPFPVMGIDITATDNCSQAVSITSQDVSQQNPDPMTCGHYTYDIIRTFTATDACGNTRTATQVIAVIDNLGPVPGGLLDTTITCEAIPVVTPPPSPLDACSGPTAIPVFVNDVISTGPCDDTYTLTRNWQAQDVCGNTSIIPQIIHVVDTVQPVLANIPADVTVECDSIPAPPDVSIFNATDNCDETVTVTLNESEIRNPDLNSCDHWTNYLIRREWTATDNCGNSRTYTQNISVQDNTGPVITTIPLVMLPAEPGLCNAAVGIPAPVSLFDKCTSVGSTIVLQDTAALVNTSGGPNNSTPVDTIVYQWPAPNIPPGIPVAGTATLKIDLKSADAEGMQEYFRVYGENGYLIGQTNPNSPPVQCGNSTTTLNIPASELNNWLADGQLTLTLAPNGTGSSAINALATCGMGTAIAELSYPIATPQIPITLLYSLDGDTAETYPPANNFTLEVGLHTVVYTAIDCAGNSTTATTNIEVQDLQPPTITPPPADTFYVSQGNCQAVVTLPFPAITDNCDVSGHLVQASANLPIIFENDPNAGLIPKDITLTISGLIPNAVSGGMLGIRHRGDNDNSVAGEFFEIFDENNVPLPGATTSGPTADQCSLFHESVFNVTANQINAWAANGGIATFKAVANDDAGNFADFIDPCAPLLPDMTDGVSRIQAVLEYSFAGVTYEIRNSSNQIVGLGSLIGNQTTDTLPPGVYTVKYSTTDINGLEGMASFQITVLDTVKPVAICESITIQVNPSGLPGDTYVLQPSEVDNGSFDNCGNLNYQLSQTNFTCGQAGSNFNITLTVTDASGNTASCSAIVSVITTILQPTYNPVCEGGTLQLYSNPPGSASSYNWSGPNNFSSPLPNPTRPALLVNQGTYCVTVTGLTGCTATGCVSVVFVTLPNQPVIAATKPSYCAGENIVLETPTYAGQNVTYQWFLDTMPGGPVLLGTTSQPIFTINQPQVGTYRYFVKVLADGCTSVNSNLLTVSVFPIPPASVDPNYLGVCECEVIALNSTTPPLVGLTYNWSGPGSFGSTQPDPLVTSCAAQVNEGIYTLITQRNGCFSTPVTVTVEVGTKPAAPEITGETNVCEGANVTLLCTQIQNVEYYEWQSPQFTYDTTNINSLVLNNVMVSDSGSWRVRARIGGCFSEWSAPILVQVQKYPDVTASSNSPVCQGNTLQLSATSDLPIATWRWTGPPADSWVVNNDPNPPRNPAVGGVYKVVGKTSFGCADSAFVTVVVVDPPVITSVTHTAPPCADGSSITLQCVVVSPNEPFNYAWTGPNLFVSNDPMPVIPNATAANSGTYMVKVFDKFGCMSAPQSTVVSIQNPPVTPTLTSIPDPPTVCAGADVTISISAPGQYTNPIYTWYTPTGDTVTTQPFIVINDATGLDDGDYLAIVAVNGCISDTSPPIDVKIKPIPPVPTATANAPLCTGDTLKLNTQLIFGATYQWSGPAGTVFVPNANVRNPIVTNVTTNNSGNYSVTVTLNGCSSTGEGVNVLVKPRPTTPGLVSNTPLCLDQPGTPLNLQVTQQTQVSGAQYSWYLAPDQLLSGPGFPVSYQTNDFTPFNPGMNNFYAVANLNGCSSFPGSIQVKFDTIPNAIPFAGMDDEACYTSPIQLAAANPVPATGHWTQVTNFPGTISSASNPSATVSGIVPGEIYQFKWTLSNGGCVNYASDTVSIETFAPEQSLVEDETIDTCYATSVQLNAIQGTTVNGYWTQSFGQQILNITIADTTDPHTFVDSLVPGNIYYFYWNLDNGACGISRTEVKVINFGARPQGTIPDQVLCSNDPCATVTAPNLANFETGLWYSDDSALNFSTPSNPSTSVCNLKRGVNKVIWMTNNGACGQPSYDTVNIVYDLYPTAVPDAYDVDFGTTLNFDVLLNDILPQQYSVTIDTGGAPMHGTLTNPSLGQYTYRPDVTFSGEDQMVYKVCNLVCPVTSCSTATVIFKVGSVDDCEIFNVITPNDDSVNDFFFVPCLGSGEIADSEVTIFNQWGDVVYHAQPYDNNNPWRGDYKGQELPVGTYFYVVKLNGQSQPKTGFLQLQR